MAVKFNKELLLKQRFWILASITACLTLGGLFYLQLYGSTDAENAVKKIKTAHKAGLALAPKSNTASIEFWKEKAKVAREAEEKVWKAAYKAQEDLFRWAALPPGEAARAKAEDLKVEDFFDFQHGKFAHEIKISKLPDPWPDDKDVPLAGQLQVVHGTLVQALDHKAKIKTRKGEIWIYPTKDIPILDADVEPNRPLVWGQEVKAQEGRFVTVTYQTGKYFGDKLLDKEESRFAKSYDEEIHDILRIVDPLTDQGKGVVQLNKWPYSKDKLPKEADGVKFIRFMNKKRGNEEGWDMKNSFYKEAWAAQEDIWIQREIYQIIRDVNDEISMFKAKTPMKKYNETTKKTDLAKTGQGYVFNNGAFEITLTMLAGPEEAGKQKVRFTIKNLLKRRQKLDLSFRIDMSDRGTAPIFQISGDPLMPNGDKNGHDSFTPKDDLEYSDKEFPRKGFYLVEQILSWETAAIKRIDHISIGSAESADMAQSHRSFPKELVGLDPPAPPKDKPADAGAGGGGGSGMKPPAPGGVGNAGIGGNPGGGGGGGAGVNKTMMPHGYWTDRYVDVTEQSRRVPVAVAIIVEQDHVNRILTHFNNSKLRFLQSQVLLNHYSGSLQPDGQKKEEGGGGAPPKVGEGKFGGGFGVPMPGAGVPMPNAGGADVETNMELVIYGTMTLYQRYPPRPLPEKKQ